MNIVARILSHQHPLGGGARSWRGVAILSPTSVGLWPLDLAHGSRLIVIFTVVTHHLLHLYQCLWISLHRFTQLYLFGRLHTGHTLHLPPLISIHSFPMYVGQLLLLLLLLTEKIFIICVHLFNVPSLISLNTLNLNLFTVTACRNLLVLLSVQPL